MNDNDDFDPEANVLAENIDIKTRLRMHIATMSGGQVITTEQQQVIVKAEIKRQVNELMLKELNEAVQEEFEETVREALGYGGWQ
ncbi:MAG: hypothetical protein RR740_00520 [Pseudomonas sp.]